MASGAPLRIDRQVPGQAARDVEARQRLRRRSGEKRHAHSGWSSRGISRGLRQHLSRGVPRHSCGREWTGHSQGPRLSDHRRRRAWDAIHRRRDREREERRQLGEDPEHLTVAKSRSRTMLGVDVGTSSAKVVLIDERGAVLRSASGEYPLATPKPGWTEQNPEDWHRVVERCIRDIDAPANAPIGFTGQMHGAVFLDSDDRVIRPAPLWNDQRTTAECAAIERTVGAEAVRAITGNPALTSFQLPKLLWLRAHEPQNAKRVASLLLPKDYVRLEITGERMTDVADASGTGAFDLQRRTWSQEILSAMAVDAGVF